MDKVVSRWMRRWTTQETLGVSSGRLSGLSSFQRAMGDLFHSQLELVTGTLFTGWKLHSVVQFRQRYRYAERAEVD